VKGPRARGSFGEDICDLVQASDSRVSKMSDMDDDMYEEDDYELVSV
jgi:hypothetical protein